MPAGLREAGGSGDAPPGGLLAEVAATAWAGGLRYEVTLRGQPADAADGFFLEISGDRVPPEVDRHDFVVLALLFLAMRSGRDLHVRGRLSRRLLRNLEEFQRAWCAWRPYWYRPVRIGCDEEVPEAAPSLQRRAVLAYSGGVDSNFALVDQLENPGRDGRELVTGVLVQGFDVPLDAGEGFAATLADARASTAAMGVPLTVVCTNMREAFSRQWPDEFGAALAACLAVFAPLAGTGLVAADHDYRHLVFPWGSNVITNPMLSSDAFRLLTLGSALGRTERVRRLAGHPALTEHIRVCWLGTVPGRNCGTCEKCIRTKLNFIAAGIPVPDGLGAMPGFLDVIGLVADDRQKIDFLADIAAAGRQGTMPSDTRLALVLCIWKNRLLGPVRHLRRKRRNIGRWLTGRPPRRH